MYELLMDIARKHGLQGFTADVLATNKAMLKVYEKAPYPVKSVLSDGVYSLTILFPSRPGPRPKAPCPNPKFHQRKPPGGTWSRGEKT